MRLGIKNKLPLIAAISFLALAYPAAAHASPFDTGFNNLQTLFTGTIAKVGSNR